MRSIPFVRQVRWATIAALIICVGSSAAAFQGADAAAMWKVASQRQIANLRGIRSIELDYTMSMSWPDGVRRYTATAALEGGLMIEGDSFDGKSHQRVEISLEGAPGAEIVERASPGGRRGEARSRSSHFPRMLQVGDENRLSCALPDMAAGYGTLRSLLLVEPVALAESAEVNDDGAIVFRLASQKSGSKFEITCDPEASYMPTRVRTWTVDSDRGVLALTSDTAITNAAVTGPDGSVWFYPASGRQMTYDGSTAKLAREWDTDLASLKINHDVPDGRFFLRPRDGEGMWNPTTGEFVQRPADSPDNDSPDDKRRNGRESAETAPPVASVPREQPVYDAGGRWSYGGFALGGVLLLAATGMFFWHRRRG